MSNKSKVFVLLPDGIGLKNFAFSNFFKEGKEQGFETIYWNNTPFDLASLGFSSVDIQNSKSHRLTEIFKNARKQIELNLFIKKTNDFVYDTYRFPFSYATLKKCIKSILTHIVVQLHNNDKGLERLRAKIKRAEKNTIYYRECIATLRTEKPALVFCTNQRPMTAIAPILAARVLGIPTACFIFSWDNLPKATLLIETDYYFVWSEHMKKELLYYYSYIKCNQVFITGTPQFENHYDFSLMKTRKMFYEEHSLDLNKKYICYSGDDITTCPDDPKYLENVATAVYNLNKQGFALGLIFRRCPVDFSSRFDSVLKDFNDVIVSINPKWKKIGESWNAVLPTVEDTSLQTNTILHSEMVVNLGSSMVFDYAAHQKPCAFINYDISKNEKSDWSTKKIYNYIHFKSMPLNNSVLWLNSANEIEYKIKESLSNSAQVVENAQKWFEIVAGETPAKSSEKIWQAIDRILLKESITA
ncbi:UDP-glycosyltransferase [Flavobacterium sp. TMP13]|uniref:UDP-glycosyltransferase n=1 Tax=Flavobacterium sp. TMP13 TaxID=3425950 RepID=UPI003D76F3C9